MHDAWQRVVLMLDLLNGTLANMHYVQCDNSVFLFERFVTLPSGTLTLGMK